MQRIYISYSPEDAEFANELASSLTKRGLYVWMDDEDTRSNKKLSDDDLKALQNYDVLLVIVSPESKAFSAVIREWRWFRDNGKPVVPVMLHPTIPHSEFSNRHMVYFDKAEIDYEAALDQLYRQLAYGVSSKQKKAGTATAIRLLERLAAYLRRWWAWLPFLFMLTICLLYFAALYPPGERFNYPLGSMFGMSVTALGDASEVKHAFVLACPAAFFISCFIYAHGKYRDLIRVIVLIPATILMALECGYLFENLAFLRLTDRWTQVDMAQTSDHRFYLVQKEYDTLTSAWLVMMCNHRGVTCEIMNNDYVHDSNGRVIETSGPREFSLEVVGDTINVRDGDTVVSTMPIP